MTEYRKYTFAEKDMALRITVGGKLSDAVHLDTNGVVIFPGGMMHPESFRFLVGEHGYQELLKRPRVQSEYTDDELKQPEAGK